MQRIALVVVTAVAIVVGGPAAAYAGDPGDPPSSAPALLGTTYGTVSHNLDATSPNGKDSGYGSDCDLGGPALTEGASVYRFDAPAGTRVRVSTTDDQGGQSLCAVELLSDHAGGTPIASLYTTAAARAPYRVGFDPCPLTGSSCSEDWTLPAADTYYLVFWPAGNDAPNSATFSFTAGVLQPTASTVTLSNFMSKSTCYRVNAAKTFTVNGYVSPDPGASTVHLTMSRYSANGTWAAVYSQDLTTAGGVIHHSFSGLKFGMYRARLSYPGTQTIAPSAGSACIAVATATKSASKFIGWYKMEADYFLYHQNKTITLTLRVAPGPAGGHVIFRLMRENNNRTYSAITTFRRTVYNGMATLTFTWSLKRGLPYYRMRGEYSGDAYHFASRSIWRCLEITR